MNKASLFSAAVLTGLSLIAASCNNTQQNTTGENKAPEATAAQGAIVYFNLDTILNDYDMANDLRSVVETKLNKGLLTQSVAQTQNQKLVEQQQSFETYAGQKQQEILEEQQVMMNQIADAINNYITEFNADGKYAMIIATQGDILSTPVVAADPALDITDILLEGLNAAYVKEKNSQK